MESSRLIPRLVISGTHSNVGKTTFMVSLMNHFKKLGLKVCSFKCGPDYLDPTYHKRVTNRDSINLDSWMMGKEGVLQTFLDSSAGFDIALIEGVMGLFDGASPKTDEGSTAEIAKVLKAPVLLVTDGSGMSRSAAALFQGFKNFDQDLNLMGVLFNKVGSLKHLDLLKEAVGEKYCYGGMVKGDSTFAFQGRHLGLETASKQSVPLEKINYWSDHSEATLEVSKILNLARVAPPLPLRKTSRQDNLKIESDKPSIKMAYAIDEAFHFYYPDNLMSFKRLGVELTPFSPLHDKELPKGTQFVYLGGGYPELFAEKLSSNLSMLDSFRTFAKKGGGIYGECGGLIYLSNKVTLNTGETYPLLGLLNLDIEMGLKLKSLGYTFVESLEDSFLGPIGTKLKGHQFRYSDFKENKEESPSQISKGNLKIFGLTKKRNGMKTQEGFRFHNVVGTYVHSHFASNPDVPQNIVNWILKEANYVG